MGSLEETVVMLLDRDATGHGKRAYQADQRPSRLHAVRPEWRVR